MQNNSFKCKIWEINKLKFVVSTTLILREWMLLRDLRLNFISKRKLILFKMTLKGNRKLLTKFRKKNI